MNDTTRNDPGSLRQPSDTDPAEESPNQDLLGNDAVWTPEIQLLGTTVARWIRLDLPGAIVVGKQRCGKTWACSYLEQVLPTLVGYPVATLTWKIPSVDVPRERPFYQDRLIDSGCTAVSHRDLAILKQRLFSYIVEHADRDRARRVVIIVDDAQNLLVEHYDMLMHCFNRLEGLRRRPFFLLVGQPELRNTASNWKEGNALQIVGRFFTHIYQFRGIGLDDLEVVLESFVFTVQGRTLQSTPLTTGLELTDGDWNLVAIADPLREAIHLLLAKQNISETVRLPMQYLRACVLSLLNYLVENKVSPTKVSTALMLHCLNESGFPSVMLCYVETS